MSLLFHREHHTSGLRLGARGAARNGIALQLAEDFPWNSVEDLVIQHIRRAGATSVADIGGGRCPRISLDAARKLGLDYHVLDISAQELALAPHGYRTIQVDMTAPDIERKIDRKFDFAFSIFFLEHIEDPLALHQNIWKILVPGGTALHIFPTLYALPFVVNAITPDRLSHALLRLVQPHRSRRAAETTKFPAYYRWCRGPTRAMIARFESLGYQVEEYVGYFGHNYYARIPFGREFERLLSMARLKLQLSHFTALAHCALRKPA
jgi:SAM-dependent methyltransferase